MLCWGFKYRNAATYALDLFLKVWCKSDSVHAGIEVMPSYVCIYVCMYVCM